MLDADGLHVIPGIVDPEIHLGAMAALDEDLASESRAAIALGVTTCNLQQTSHTIFRKADGRQPPEKDLLFSDLVETFREIGEQHSYCDFMLTPLLMREEQALEI